MNILNWRVYLLLVFHARHQKQWPVWDWCGIVLFQHQIGYPGCDDQSVSVNGHAIGGHGIADNAPINII